MIGRKKQKSKLVRVELHEQAPPPKSHSFNLRCQSGRRGHSRHKLSSIVDNVHSNNTTHLHSYTSANMVEKVRSLLATDHLVAVVLLRQDLHGGLDDPAPQPQHQVKRRLFLDVVVAQRPAVFQLLPGEDETLLVGRDTLLVLNLGLHILNGVAGLHLPREKKSRFLSLSVPSRSPRG